MSSNPSKFNKTVLLQIALFIITLITTTLAGSEWIFGRGVFLGPAPGETEHWLTLDKFLQGLSFSLPFLGILTIHEFGHYFTAQYYKVKVSLPYYLPLWFGNGISLGTLGAFIRIKDAIKSRKEYFDIGLAGPLAGFIAALLVLFYGFTHLPNPEYIFTIHPEYKAFGLDYAAHVYKKMEGNFGIGHNLLFWLFENYVADPALVPNHYELMHYPYLLAGFLACFFTALNLMPIGQLDGGHILYGLAGEKGHQYISTTLYIAFLFFAGLGVVQPFQTTEAFLSDALLFLVFLMVCMGRMFPNMKSTLTASLAMLTIQVGIVYVSPTTHGYDQWLVFALVLGRFLGIQHPKVEDQTPLSLGRKVLGWMSLGIFILCFSPSPFEF